MDFCVFAHTEDNKPKPRSKPWKDLVTDLTRHRETTVDKNHPDRGRIDIPLLSMVTYKPNTLRAKHNILTVNAAVLDIDTISHEEWHQIEDSLRSQRVSSFWYTTFSHTPEYPKLRLGLELSRSVTGQDWTRIFPILQKTFNADPNARDTSRMFFGPYIPPGAPCFSGYVEGEPLQVESLLVSTDSTGLTVTNLPPDPAIIVTKELLTKLSGKLSRKTHAEAQLASRMIRHVRDGEEFTEEGHRDEAVFRYIIASIVKEWPNLNTQKLTELATPSLTLNGGVTPDQFFYKVEREKQNRQKINEENYRKQKEKHNNSLAKANLNRVLVGVDSYYVVDTLPEIDAEALVSGKQLNIPIQQAKIVQHQSDFYFWCNGTYQGPIQKGAFIQAAIKYLSPFEEIETELFDGFGNLKEINVDNFMNHHGQFVKEVIFALGSRETSLTKDALILPYYPPLPTQATYSWKVDYWINYLFGGTAYPTGVALDRVRWAWKWLCHYTDHTLLLPALLFVGKTGAGKGLFAEWLSQAYSVPATVAPMDLLYATGNENDVYPVMVADEEFPDTSSAQIREGITNKVHVLKKKYQNIRKVTGYVRHIFILNDADRIKTFDVGNEAQRATAERFMYIPVTEECRTYLEALCDADQRLQPGELQGHIAWLKEQGLYQETSKSRFAVEVPQDNRSFYETFYRQMTRYAVLNVVCDFICQGTYPIGLEDRYRQWPIEVLKDGTVKIRPAPFAEYCEDKLEDRDRSKAAIGRVLKSIAEPMRTATERYWILQTSHLYRWAEIAMEYSDEVITENLNKTTESKIDSVVGLSSNKVFLMN